MNVKAVAAEIVGVIVNEIRTDNNAMGVRHCWEALDPEIRGLIRADWAISIEAILREHVDDQKNINS